MVERLDFNELNELIKEYLAFHKMEHALDCFKAEEKTKQYSAAASSIKKAAGTTASK
jgi:hypothetical protein